MIEYSSLQAMHCRPNYGNLDRYQASPVEVSFLSTATLLSDNLMKFQGSSFKSYLLIDTETTEIKEMDEGCLYSTGYLHARP